MKGKGMVIFLVIIVIVLAIVLKNCNNSAPPSPSNPADTPSTKPSDEPVRIGEVSREEARVWHHVVNEGESELTDSGGKTLYRGDGVNVSEDGKALLRLGGVEVYLLAKSDMLVGEGSSENFNIINLRLALGGIICENNSEEKLVSFLNEYDVKADVYGTTMFFFYDNEYAVSWIGNFDGHVDVESGGEILTLPAGQMTAVRDGQPPEDPVDLYFSRDELMETVDAGFTPVEIMRVEVPAYFPQILYPIPTPDIPVTEVPGAVTEEAAAEEPN